MKILFAGTPEFSASALAALLDAGHEIVGVLTQPDRPAGRGMQLMPSPVKRLAMMQGLPILQPVTLKDYAVQEQLAALHPEVMIVAAYGLILPRAILELPRYGCLNIHASLLPRWRGAAPIQRALLAGDKETGITIMQMDEGLDTGPMLLKSVCPIQPQDTAGSLHDKLAALGAQAIVTALQRLQSGELVGETQDEAQACYAAKLGKAEAQLNWIQCASEVERAIRGYNPYPGAWTVLRGQVIKIWRARVHSGIQSAPGRIVHVGRDQLWVACGEGGLALEVLQRPNAKALPVEQFLRGMPLDCGEMFALPSVQPC